jgi:4-amino-4-deoxy-L-arabinose transferase-like glycosyltransferase
LKLGLLLPIVLVGFAVRLAWSIWAEPEPPFFSDAVYYDAAARSLARGEGYSVLLTHEGFFPGGDETAFFPPGYSFLLAIAYWVFGEGFGVARLLNVVLSTLTLPLVYLIGRRLFSGTAGLLGAGLAAVHPSLVLWTPVMLSETAFAFFFAAAAVVLLYAAPPSGGLSLRQAAVGGGLVGVAMLVRGQALVLLPAVVAWWALAGIERRQVLQAGCAALGAAVLVLLPWAVRSSLIFNYPVLLSTNVGYNLRVGHAPYSTGRFIDPDDIYFGNAATYQDLELLLHRNGLRLALDYAVGNPRRELELSIEKARWTWSPDWDVLTWVESFGARPLRAGWYEPLKSVVIAGHWLTVGLALTSLVAWRKQGGGLFFVALAGALWTGMHMVFFGEPRFRLPLLPMLLPASALGLLLIGKAVGEVKARIRNAIEWGMGA